MDTDNILSLLPKDDIKTILYCNDTAGKNTLDLMSKGYKVFGFNKSGEDVLNAQFENPSLAVLDKEFNYQHYIENSLPTLKGYRPSTFDLIIVKDLLDHTKAEEITTTLQRLFTVSKSYVYLSFKGEIKNFEQLLINYFFSHVCQMPEGEYLLKAKKMNTMLYNPYEGLDEGVEQQL